MRTWNRFRISGYPWYLRFMHHLRGWIGRLGLRRYNYSRTLAFLYRKSNRYASLFDGYAGLVFSPVGVLDKRVIYEARNAGLKMICWVYSWDNPMKDNEFMPDADRYFVWNKENRDDLRDLYDIPAHKVDIVGPVQFDFLLKRARPVLKKSKRPYVLYAFTVGVEPYITQEIRLVRRIRAILDEIRPDIQLLARPYPFIASRDAYAALRDCDHIEILEYGEYHENKTLISGHDLEEKMRQTERAEYMINYISTWDHRGARR